jgi:peroxiredoxin
MNMIRSVILVCAMAVSAMAATTEMAPNFTLADTKGKTVTLSQLKGKVVFVDFWASWCPPCRRSIPAVESMYKQLSKDPRVVILGINVEKNPASTLAFVKKNGIQYTVLNDDGSASEAYRVSGIPAFFIIGPAGAITKRFVGFHADMQKEWMAEIETQLNAVENPAKKTSR